MPTHTYVSGELPSGIHIKPGRTSAGICRLVPPGNLSRVPAWWRARDRLGTHPSGEEIDREIQFLRNTDVRTSLAVCALSLLTSGTVE